LLFDLGQVYALKGDRQQAIAQFRRYLELEPNGRAAQVARHHIEELSVAPEPPLTPEASPTPPPADPPEESKEAQPFSVPQPAPPAPLMLSAPDHADPTRARNSRRQVGIGLATIGGLAAASAIATAVLYEQNRNTIDAHCSGYTCDPRGLDAVGRSSTLTLVSILSIATATVGLSSGIVMLLTPQITPSATGFSVSARF
jgi:hypothetical protein